jgi:hypothetical protein
MAQKQRGGILPFRSLEEKSGVGVIDGVYSEGASNADSVAGAESSVALREGSGLAGGIDEDDTCLCRGSIDCSFSQFHQVINARVKGPCVFTVTVCLRD